MASLWNWFSCSELSNWEASLDLFHLLISATSRVAENDETRNPHFQMREMRGAKELMEEFWKNIEDDSWFGFDLLNLTVIVLHLTSFDLSWKMRQISCEILESYLHV